MNLKSKIISILPYDKPFLFVDEILEIRDGFVKGHYTFPKDAEFYKGHFKDKPITPGVLLTECAAQIALACYGILKMKDKNLKVNIAMTSSEMEFLKLSYPEEKLTVVGEEIYFRFQKLKMAVKIYNPNQTLIAKGQLAGMIINSKFENHE